MAERADLPVNGASNAMRARYIRGRALVEIPVFLLWPAHLEDTEDAIRAELESRVARLQTRSLPPPCEICAALFKPPRPESLDGALSEFAVLDVASDTFGVGSDELYTESVDLRALVDFSPIESHMYRRVQRIAGTVEGLRNGIQPGRGD